MRRVVLLVLLAPLLSGCVAVAAAGIVGIGAVSYRRNEVERDYAAPLTEVWVGTLDGLRSLGIYPTLAELDATEGLIEYQDLRVVVERHPEGFTRVRVRVGTFHTADHARRAEVVSQEIDGALRDVDDVRSWGERVKELGGKGAEAAPKGE